MRHYRAAAFACALALTPAAALATPQQLTPSVDLGKVSSGGAIETFSVSGIDFAFPMPGTYCVPKGRYDTIAKTAAQMDTRNMTMVSFVSCLDMEKDVSQTRWGAVKTLLATLGGGAGSRQELIATFKAQIDPADLDRLNKQGADEAQTNIENGLGQKLDIKIDLKPLDTDDAAAYAGGMLTFQKADGEPMLISCVYAATVVKDRVFFIYFFSLKTGAREITTLLAELKMTTNAFVAANPEAQK